MTSRTARPAAAAPKLGPSKTTSSSAANSNEIKELNSQVCLLLTDLKL